MPLHTTRTVNRMADQLNSFVSEVTRAAREVGTEGKLGGQANVKSLPESGRISPAPSTRWPASSADCFSLAIQHLHPLISSAGATIEVGTLPKVIVVPVLLTQVFQNLVANALKYRREVTPLVRVAAHREGHQWIFSLQDNGIGINPRYHERIFGVFKRLNHSMEGTGIGLAICKSAVEHWGGRIWVESQPGRGATFYFSAQAAGE